MVIKRLLLHSTTYEYIIILLIYITDFIFTKIYAHQAVNIMSDMYIF